MSNYLCYLCELLTGLAFSGEKVSTDAKLPMVAGVRREGNAIPPRRVILEERTLPDKQLQDCRCKYTNQLFLAPSISRVFEKPSYSKCFNDHIYADSQAIFAQVKVVND
jgi:hypothetical protein